MSQDGLYDHIAHLDCLPQQEEPDETLRQMHERIQAEQRTAYAAKANRENVKLLIAAMEFENEDVCPPQGGQQHS